MAAVGRADVTRTGALPMGWSAFVLSGIVAAMLPPADQLVFAGLAVIGLGLPHGASDLAMVPADRRAGFLLAYIGMVAMVVIAWLVAPALALSAFLLVSVAHFATDDRAAPPIRRWATAVIIVAGPALLHRRAIEGLFGALVDDAAIVGALATVMTAAAVVAVGMIAVEIVRMSGRDRWMLAVGSGAAVALPPLVGFAIGFVLLHAAGETRERMAALGCATTADFVRSVAPVMMGALVVIAAVALVFARHASPAIGTLFAALSALAAPHMAITPLWLRERGHKPRGSRAWI